jgi:hypothetical protein
MRRKGKFPALLIIPSGDIIGIPSGISKIPE